MTTISVNGPDEGNFSVTIWNRNIETKFPEIPFECRADAIKWMEQCADGLNTDEGWCLSLNWTGSETWEIKP